MSKKSRAKVHVNRMADDRLWDDLGDEWQLVERGLSQKRTEQLFNTPGIRIGIHDDYGQPLQWLGAPAKAAFWRERVLPAFRSGPASAYPPKEYKRLRLFDASVWRRDERMMVVFDWD